MNSSSVKKNLAYQSFYEVLAIILPLLTSPYISRIIGAEGLGIFSYTYSVAYYFQLFGMLGLKFYGNRSIARVRDDQTNLNRVYSELLFLHIVLSVISLAAYIIYSLTYTEYTLYSLLQLPMVLSTLFDVSWLFFGLEKFKETVVRNSIIKIATVIAIFAFIHTRQDLWIYIIIMSVSQLAGQVILLWMSRKYVKYVKPNISNLLVHVKPMLILFIPVIATSLFKYMDKIMLGAIGNKIELGYYENAEKILNVPMGIIIASGSVMLPKISNLIANENSDVVSKYMDKSFKYMLCVAISMAFGMMGVSNVFAPVFWGAEFKASGILIEMLAITLPFSTVANIVRNQDLIPKGKDALYSVAIIIGAGANLIINWLLIPSLQSVGVTIGTIVSEILVCIVQMIMVKDRKSYAKSIGKSLVFLIPGFIMFLCVRFVGNLMGLHVYTLVIQVLVGVLIYGSIVTIYFITTKDEQFYALVSQIKAKLSR